MAWQNVPWSEYTGNYVEVFTNMRTFYGMMMNEDDIDSGVVCICREDAPDTDGSWTGILKSHIVAIRIITQADYRKLRGPRE